MTLSDQTAAIAIDLAAALGADKVEIDRFQPLGGGAIQENWSLDTTVDGLAMALVLRTDAPSQVAESLTRAQEYAVLQTAFAAGVTVPRPVALIDRDSAIGRPYYLMERLSGIALGAKVVKDRTICPDRDHLVARLGRELAAIHAIRPPQHELSFLGEPPTAPAPATIARLRRYLDELAQPQPVLEWGLRWCERSSPETNEICLLHQDFRSGNLLLGERELAAVLDWEFACWGDYHADLGWFCARCWRYSRPDLEAGGLGSRDVFYKAYETASGRRIDSQSVRFWEVIAHLRWAVIALQQAERHLSRQQPSIELALTGRVLPELERTVLSMTAPAHWPQNDGQSYG